MNPLPIEHMIEQEDGEYYLYILIEGVAHEIIHSSHYRDCYEAMVCSKHYLRNTQAMNQIAA